MEFCSKNAQQIIKYLTTYNNKYSILTTNQLDDLKNNFSQILENSQTRDTKKLLSLMSEIREICKNFWAKFDVLLMFFGLFTFTVELFLYFC